MKVVFHIDKPEKWQTVLSNIINLLESGKKDIRRVEVVANGKAVLGYIDSNLAIPMHELTELGVRFSSCQNAMNANEVDKISIHPFIKVVPAGVLRLVELQTADYAYIKP